MNCHRVLLLVLLASSGVLSNPQWPRQSSLSSPLSVGMRFLDNIRNGMTNTFRGIFGGGPPQGKEIPINRPVRQHLSPPPPAPIAPVHNIGTERPSSFFTVVHEEHPSHEQHPSHEHRPSHEQHPSHEHHPATSFPETPGFTDESFRPIEFFNGNSPFQGTVEEETLSHQPHFTVDDPHSFGPVNPDSVSFSGNPQTQGFSPVHSEPSSFSKDSQTSSFAVDPQPPSFAVIQDDHHQSQQQEFQAPFPSNPSSNHGESSIPFGNTNHFHLGQGFADAPTNQLPLAPRPIFAEDLQVREDLSRAPPQNQLRGQHNQHSFVSSRADGPKKKPQNPLKFTIAPNKKTTLPVIKVLDPVSFNKQRPTPQPPQEVRFTTPSTQESTTFRVIRNDKPIVAQTKITQGFNTVTQKPKDRQKKPSVHINTGTKIRLAPKSGNGDDEDAEVSSYEFGYGVLDNDTGNQFFHAEKREEGLTKGSYKIQLPDGRVQTVTYLADNKGFHPKITYEGEAQYPEDEKES